MTIAPIQPMPTNAQDIAPEDLVGNQHLTEDQKVAQASRQFEAIMLQQILSETQKPVITSEFTDDSTSAGIYQDYVTQTLAQSMAKSGTLGFAKVFEQQLSHHQNGKPVVAHGGPTTAATQATGNQNTPKPLSAVNLTRAVSANLATNTAPRHE